MPNQNINLLSREDKLPGKKRTKALKLLFYPLIFLIIFFIVFSFEVVLSGEGIVANLEKINILQNLTFGLNTDRPLSGEETDRINVLLMGIGGAGHDGPYLTDTMILISYKPSTNKVAMLSIPRDLSVPIPGYGWRRINEADSIGETKDGDGAKFAAAVVANTFNVPVNYYVRVDFSGFEKLIDELGGVDINVENSFVDNQFPAANDGYQTVAFNAGWQKMDGQTALNYARSRHGNNGENSDFARSKRQQKLLAAIKDKAFAFTTFLSFKKVTALLDMYQDHVATNLQPWEMYKFYKIARNYDSKNVTNTVLNDDPKGPLFASNINGAYLLLPKDMSFKQLQNMVINEFDAPKQAAALQPIRIEIQNGTKIEGLAYRASVELKSSGYQITKIVNADRQNYSKTVIIDLTNGQKSDELNKLKSKLNAIEAAQNPNTSDNGVDFIIILGQDQQSLTRNSGQL